MGQPAPRLSGGAILALAIGSLAPAAPSDCNRNGVGVLRDIESGTSLDCNRDFIPDECGPQFTFGVDAPAVLSGLPGETVTFEAYLSLAISNNFTPKGPQEWSTSLFCQGGTITAVSAREIVVNTIYDDPSGTRHDPNLFDLAGSDFLFDKLAAPLGDPGGEKGAVSVASLDQEGRIALQPRLTQRIARITVRTEIPAGGACDPLTLAYEDGAAPITPVHNVVSHLRRTYPAVLTSTAIPRCPSRFRRGDANSDGSVDISDAVWTLAFLYLGGDAPSCREAANSNDDALVDLSDPIHLLESLFLAGGLGRVAAPGAYHCGVGGPFRGLSCEVYPCPPSPPGPN